MLTKSEALSTVIQAMRALAKGESLPQPGTDQRDSLNTAIGQVTEGHDAADLAELGLVALSLLLSASMSDLQAHKACLEAQRDATPPRDAPLH